MVAAAREGLVLLSKTGELERTPRLEGLVTPARMLPTRLVASPTTSPIMLVAWFMTLLTSFKTLDARSAPPFRAPAGFDAAGVGTRLLPSLRTLLAMLEPSPRIAPATFVTSPNKSPSGSTALISGLIGVRASVATGDLSPGFCQFNSQ